MSVASAFTGFVRAVVIAAVTAGAALGLLAVFHPFALGAIESASASTGDTAALHERIDRARAALARTEAALDSLTTTAAVSPVQPDALVRAQYDAQIAAATERRDLARRHAAAIRDGLKSGLPLAALADIRDSVVVGQLLSQQAALEAEIAEQGARFKPSHPVMRALLAQRGALSAQIRTQAASIAAALESEADLDDRQIKLLLSREPPAATTEQPAAPSDTATLKAQAAAQRAELDALMDAYFGLSRPAAVAPVAAPAANLLSPLNLFVVAVAGAAALVFQVAFALRRRRLNADRRDLADWQAERDEPELPLDLPAVVAGTPLRRAS